MKKIGMIFWDRVLSNYTENLLYKWHRPGQN